MIPTETDSEHGMISIIVLDYDIIDTTVSLCTYIVHIHAYIAALFVYKNHIFLCPVPRLSSLLLHGMQRLL